MRLEDLLTHSAAGSPDAIAAIEPEGSSISYRQLDSYASAVASRLVGCLVSHGDRVGICAEKSIAALAAVFGILKAGAAYVPVDVGAPVARCAYIFKDCAVKAVIVSSDRADTLQAELSASVWHRHDFPAPGTHPASLVVLVRDGEDPYASVPDLAYILYTSGSTGRPKGVMHSHATALSFVDWCSHEFRPGPRDRFSSHAPFHFDLSILDIYVPIKHAAGVVLIASAAGKQPALLSDIIADHRITVWYSTPSILRLLLDFGKLDKCDCSSLRLVLFAGEVFPPKHLRALMAHWTAPAFYNLFGPTETNVCTYFPVESTSAVDADTPLPIGGVCSGDRARVVDAKGADVNLGEEGELLIAGGSVMLGYWNLPERNAETFTIVGEERWYHTGDIVRDRGDGTYIFLGRRDRMVKRRGFRIELGEIEAALHRHPNIPEAAVIAKANDEGDVLIHAFLGCSASAPTLVELKRFCSQQVPLYMIPDRFSVLSELPKTSTDKIDYQHLKGLL